MNLKDFVKNTINSVQAGSGGVVKSIEFDIKIEGILFKDLNEKNELVNFYDIDMYDNTGNGTPHSIKFTIDILE